MNSIKSITFLGIIAFFGFPVFAQLEGSLPSSAKAEIIYDDFTDLVTEIRYSETAYVKFTYDAMGNRVRKIRRFTDPNGNAYIDTTHYVHGSAGLPSYIAVNGTYTPSGGVAQHVNYEQALVHGKGYAPELVHDQTGSAYYQVANYQGSTQLVYDTNGISVASYDYDPYGVVEASATPSYSGATYHPKFRYLYTGQEHESETNLHNFRARMYSPEEKQFLTTDKAHQHTTPYAFAMNDPVNRVDLDGNVALVLSHFESTDGAAEGDLDFAIETESVHMNYNDFIQSGLPSEVPAGDINHVVFSAHGNAADLFGSTHNPQYADQLKKADPLGQEMGDAFNSFGIEPNRITLLSCESGGNALDEFVNGLNKSKFKGVTEVQGFHGPVVVADDYVELNGKASTGRTETIEHLDDDGFTVFSFNTYDSENNLVLMQPSTNENYQSFGKTGDFRGAETNPHIRRVQVDTREVSREAGSEVEHLEGAMGGLHFE